MEEGEKGFSLQRFEVPMAGAGAAPGEVLVPERGPKIDICERITGHGSRIKGLGPRIEGLRVRACEWSEAPDGWPLQAARPQGVAIRSQR